MLVVENVDTVDEGTYTVNLFNDAGKAFCSAKLKVDDARSSHTLDTLSRFISPAFGSEGFKPSPRSKSQSVSRTIAPEGKQCFHRAVFVCI